MLKIKNLYAGYNGVDVLKDISIDIQKNENIAILGPNGCGKTTLLKSIAGLLPSRGTIELDGKNIQNMKRKEIAMNVAMMSQITSVYFSYSVFETVMLGRYNHMKDGFFKEASKLDREYVEHCLNIVEIADIRNKQITELSGGQLQRVFLARTLAQEPKVILLDEPTNHLDLKHQTELMNYLNEWSKVDGHTVIGVLHDINLAMQLSDKAIFMRDGEIVAHGRVNEIVNSGLLKEVYDMDVVQYMQKSLKMWESFANA